MNWFLYYRELRHKRVKRVSETIGFCVKILQILTLKNPVIAINSLFYYENWMSNGMSFYKYFQVFYLTIIPK